jgi:dCTP deaminase
MILPAQQLRALQPVEPFVERSVAHGMTYGVGPAGYDVRVAQDLTLEPGAFALASTIERFAMPADVIAFVHDKSTWARRGLAAQNTVIEPGWFGFLTLELTNHGRETLAISAGMPIAQVVFHRLLESTDTPYSGRYQDQAEGPQPARLLAQAAPEGAP